MVKFSIIINTYNQEKFIKETVDSALSQTCSSMEIIVVDDASKDGTVAALDEFVDRIKLIKLKENHGANKARNIGAAAAEGRFLVHLDGDDLFLPWAMQTYERIIDLKQTNILLCKLLHFKGPPPTIAFNSFGETLKIVEYENMMKKDHTYRGSVSAIVIDRDLFHSVGGWSEEIWPSEIDDMQMKLAYSGKTIQILSHPTIAYRVHDAQTMHQVHRFISTMHLVINKEKRGEYPGGRKQKRDRQSFMGGPLFYWVKTAFQEKLYVNGLKLLLNGWLCVVYGILRRIRIKISGATPMEEISM